MSKIRKHLEKKSRAEAYKVSALVRCANLFGNENPNCAAFSHAASLNCVFAFKK